MNLETNGRDPNFLRFNQQDIYAHRIHEVLEEFEEWRDIVCVWREGIDKEKSVPQ